MLHLLLTAVALAQPAPEAGAAPILVPPRLLEAPELPCPEHPEPGDREVVVLLRLHEDGQVESVSLVRGREDLAEAALEASWRLHFSPAREEGAPVAVELPFTWSFADCPGQEAPPTDHESVATYRPRVVAVHSLDAEEIRTLPGSLGDPVRALVNLPGFTRSPLESGWLLVRGSGPGDTGVYLEGARQPLLFHLGGFTSLLHPQLVSSVRFSPVAWSARYGGHTAGAVELVPAPPPAELEATAGVNLVWSHAMVEAPLGKGWGLSMGGRRSYLDGVLSLVLDETRASIAPRFSDVQLRASRPGLSFTLLGLSDALDLPSSVGGGQVLSVRQKALQGQAEASHRLGRGVLTSSLWIALRESSLSSDSSGLDQIPITDQETLVEPGGRVAWEAGLGGVHLGLGLDGHRTSWEITRDGLGRSSPAGSLSPWTEVSGHLGPARLRAGARLDTFLAPGQLPRLDLSPLAEVDLRLSERAHLALRGGRSHQPPELALVLGLPEGTFLPLERSDAAEVQLRWAHQQLALESTLWARRMSHLAEWEQDGSLGQLQGRAHGVEGQVRWKPERAEVRLLGQLSRSDRREEPSDEWTPWRYHQDLRLALTASRELPRDWLISTRIRWASGYHLDERADMAWDILTQQDLLMGADAKGRLQDWYAVDVKIARAWERERLDWEVSLDIQNLTWRRVPEPTINGFDDTWPVYGVGLPLLPIFGVEGRWHPASAQPS